MKRLALLAYATAAAVVVIDQIAKAWIVQHLALNATVQVLPFAAGAHPGGDGTFAILSFPAELEFDPGAVYVQTRITGYYYEQPDELARYRDDLTRLQIQAIKPEQTPAFIHRIAEDL